MRNAGLVPGMSPVERRKRMQAALPLAGDPTRPHGAVGIVLDNATDMAMCFPDLWPSAAAARQDRVRSVTNCYYRSFYNSQMSHSSVEVTYRPIGAGYRARIASVDLARIPDPETWLTNRIGPLANCEIRRVENAVTDAPEPSA